MFKFVKNYGRGLQKIKCVNEKAIGKVNQAYFNEDQIGKERRVVDGAEPIGMMLLMLCLNMLMLASPLLIWLIYVCNLAASTCFMFEPS